MTQPFEDLQHRDHRVRRAAIPRAAAHDDRWALLSPLLLDAYPPARHDAALALGERAAEDLALLDRLIALIEADDADLRQRQAALIALTRAGRVAPDPAGPPWARACAAARRWIDHPEPDLRFQALCALEHAGAHGPDLIAALLPRLRDPDDDALAQAAAILARLGALEALSPLSLRWEHLNNNARRVALMAMARLLALPGADQRARPPVIAALQREARGLEVGLEACAWLGRLGAHEATAALQAITGGWFTHPLLKVAAAAALVRLGHPDGERALARFLRARRRDARGFAMEQIGELGLHAFTDALGESLLDPRSYHSDTAAIALGMLNSDRARALLQRAAHDPREAVRAEVARALST